jgi:hypothetical protein
MALHFQNEYSKTAYVAIVFYDPSCGAANQNFRKIGWYPVKPGQSIVPAIPSLDGDLTKGNARAYFFAQVYGGSQGGTWTGSGNGWIFVPNSAAFSLCAFEDNEDTQQQVDFKDIEFGPASDVFVVLFDPPFSEVQVPID